MDQEASDELIGAQGHGFVAHTVFGAIVLPLERNTTFIMGDESMIGDGDAVSITRQIREHGLWSGKRLLRIDVPVRLLQRRQVLCRTMRVLASSAKSPKKCSLLVTVCLVKPFQEQTPEQT